MSWLAEIVQYLVVDLLKDALFNGRDSLIYAVFYEPQAQKETHSLARKLRHARHDKRHRQHGGMCLKFHETEAEMRQR
jgi:hypothetical protein